MQMQYSEFSLPSSSTFLKNLKKSFTKLLKVKFYDFEKQSKDKPDFKISENTIKYFSYLNLNLIFHCLVIITIINIFNNHRQFPYYNDIKLFSVIQHT